MILGIHHITAIAASAQANRNFYEGVLGLRFLKKTVNFDDPTTYHLYYGDYPGTPGSIITFFPWEGIPKGKRGRGEVTAVAYSVPPGSLHYWRKRIASLTPEEPSEIELGDAPGIRFIDESGGTVELFESADTDRYQDPGSSFVDSEHAIRGFHHATISSLQPDRTADLLESTLGFRPLPELKNERVYVVGDGSPGTRLRLAEDDVSRNSARTGAGSVHHIALRVADQETHRAMREKLVSSGYQVSPVIDRNYFDAIYFREPGGVHFEISTDPPGFTADEQVDELGRSLKLPAMHEDKRSYIEERLPALQPAQVSPRITS